MNKQALLALLAVFAAFATTAQAAERRIFEKITSLQMKELLATEGFKGIEIDGDDDLIVKMQGYRVLVIVRGSDYTNIQFRLAVRNEASLEWVNTWNAEKKYTKSYLDSEGDPVLEMDLDLAGGVTDARIRDGISTFSQSIIAFIKELP